MTNPNSIRLDRFESELAELPAYIQSGRGSHESAKQVSGQPDQSNQVRAFDYVNDQAGDIDFTIPETYIHKEWYVNVGTDLHPTPITMVHDTMARNQQEHITQAKLHGAEVIAQSIFRVAPVGDDMMSTGIVTAGVTLGKYNFDDVVQAAPNADGAKTISDIAVNGLGIVISDFVAMEFKPRSLNNVVAFKVNHWSEQNIPDNCGRLDVGNGIELNSNTRRGRRTIEQYNQSLKEQDERTDAQLKRAGAQIVSITLDGLNGFHGIDAKIADRQAAKAVRTIGSRL